MKYILSQSIPYSKNKWYCNGHYTDLFPLYMSTRLEDALLFSLTEALFYLKRTNNYFEHYVENSKFKIEVLE